MFKYKVEVKNSKNPKMGLGLFASEIIKSDTIVWEFIEGLDIRINEDTLNKLNNAQREFFKKYGWKEDDGNYYSSCDLTNFINHSFTPNLICVGEIIKTNKDIEIGEELFINYEDFDVEFETYKNELI
jgi:SET domain-containing protein